MFNGFPSKCAVAFYTIYEQNRTCRFYTEDFVPLASFFLVVGSLSWLIKGLIVKTVNIWWVLYINQKGMYLSKTCACTIIECEVVRNVCNFTPTWPFISWWYSAAKHRWKSSVFHYNEIMVICFDPFSVVVNQFFS